jgi:bile acid:Na+ symporter, BASS family
MNELLGAWPGMSLLNASIVMLLTALGLRTRPADVLLLFRNPVLGARALVAMFVFVPACTILMTWSLPLEPAIRASLLAMSVAPVCPVPLRAATNANTDSDYMLGLQVFAAAVSIAAVPAMLILAERIFDFETRYPIGDIAFFILRQIGIPLAVGMGLARLLGGKRERVALWLERIGVIAMITATAVILYFLIPKIWSMTVNGRLLSVVAFTGVVLLGGRLFGGPDKGTRNNLIMGSINRHPALSLLIATTVLPAEEATMIAVIIMFVLVGFVVSIPYIFKLKDSSVA